MTGRIILLALAGASLTVGAPALAQGRGGGHGGGHGSGAAAHGNMGGVGHGIDMRTDARVNSQGPNHASDRAIERANENSVLYGTTRTRSDLSLLRTGLTLRTSGGTTLGTIRRINRSRDGTVRNVLVQSSTGMRTIPVAPNTLSISGDVVTTTGARPRRGR